MIVSTVIWRLLVLCVGIECLKVCLLPHTSKSCGGRCRNSVLQFAGKGFGQPSVPKTANNSINGICSCGSTLVYSDCCGKFHRELTLLENRDLAPDSLVRSRYVAYENGFSEFLVATTHVTQNDYAKKTSLEASKALKKWKKELMNHCDRIEFYKIAVLRVDDPSDIESLKKDHVFPSDLELHSVLFRYFCRQDSAKQITVIEELSGIVYGPNNGHLLFSKEDQVKPRWSYAHSIWRPLTSEEELVQCIEGDEELQKLFSGS